MLNLIPVDKKSNDTKLSKYGLRSALSLICYALISACCQAPSSGGIVLTVSGNSGISSVVLGQGTPSECYGVFPTDSPSFDATITNDNGSVTEEISDTFFPATYTTTSAPILPRMYSLDIFIQGDVYDAPPGLSVSATYFDSAISVEDVSAFSNPFPLYSNKSSKYFGASQTLIIHTDITSNESSAITIWGDIEAFASAPPPPKTRKCKKCGSDEIIEVPENKPCPPNYTEAPITYSDGSMDLTAPSLISSGFGKKWGPNVSFYNGGTDTPADGIAGFNTINSELPFLYSQITQTTTTKSMGYWTLVASSSESITFDAGSSGTFSSQQPDLHMKLVSSNEDGTGVGNLLEAILPNGEKAIFSPIEPTAAQKASSQYNLKMVLYRYIDKYGHITTISSTSDGRPTLIQRTDSTTGTPITEQWSYVYNTTGVNEDRLASVTWSKRIGSTGAFTIIRTTEYVQSDGTDVHANQTDLMLIRVIDAGGHILDTTYMRYYTLADGGHEHLLKYMVRPASYDRMMAATGATSPDSLTDTQVALYADNYFEYIGNSVSKEVVQGAGCSCSGLSGQGAYTYSRTDNTNSDYHDGFNSWKSVATETLPDGNKNIVYTNYIGDVMLKYHLTITSGGSTIDKMEFYRYDSNGEMISKIETSAFKADADGKYFDPVYNDLLGFDGDGFSSYLFDDAGLIHTYTYGTADPTSSGIGDPIGYVHTVGVQKGQKGSSVIASEYDYSFHTNGGHLDIRPASVTNYRDYSGLEGEQVTYSYTWYSGTNAIQTRTTTRSAGGSTRNGPAASIVTVEYYDTYGNVVWTKDPDGYIAYAAYDIPTGSSTKQVVDAYTNATDTSSYNAADFASTDLPVPSGFVSLTGVTHQRLITNYAVDNLGRITAVIDPRGNSTYTVYKDADHEIREYAAWDASAHAPIIPTHVTREDRANNYTEFFSITTIPSLDSSNLPNGGETVSIDKMQTLTRTLLDLSSRPIEIDRYFNFSGITSYGTTPYLGSNGVNYYNTFYGYDVMGRRARAVNALGDVTRSVFDGLGRSSSTWVGIDDTVSSGVWSKDNPGTNMIKVSENEYDSGGLGDSNLTHVTQYISSSETRVAQMYYDWRDRLVATKSGVSTSETDNAHRPIAINTLDNLGEVTTRQTYDGDGLTIGVDATTGVASVSDTTKLRTQSDTRYDDQGRVYQTKVYSVNQSTGAVSTNALTSNTFYDLRGNVIATYSPGGLVKKSVYDGAGRLSTTSTSDGATDSGYASASVLTGNNVLEQILYTYDANGNIIETQSKSRNHDETATGDLGTPTSSPKARVRYSTAYYDAANRIITSAAYGTDGSALTTSVPTTMPSTSDILLVTTTTYGVQGWAQDVTDPKGLVTHTLYDAAGRVTSTIENYKSMVNGGAPSASYPDTNRTTSYTYDGLDHALTLTAVQPSGGSTPSQTTQYVYGVTATTVGGVKIGINSNSLLAKVEYPNKTTGSASTSAADQNVFTYDALGEVLTKTDQNGSVHTYTYDVLGRTVLDAVTTLATNVDGSVRAVGITFDTAGRPYQLTSYSDAAATTAVNQVVRGDFDSSGNPIPGYNGLGQLVSEYQSHTGTVTTSNHAATPRVKYAYAGLSNSDTATNYSRLSSMTYPNSRPVYYLYADAGDSSGLSDKISRVTSLASASARGTNDANVIASYDYMGLSTVVRKNYPTPGIRMDRFGGTSGTYAGLDPFDRVISQQWIDYTPSTGVNATTGGTDGLGNVFNIAHGYDRDSNRLYANNATQTGASHVYNYDNLNRLTTDKAGANNSANTDVPFWQSKTDSWTLDPLGNPTTAAGIQRGEHNTVNAQNQITTRTLAASQGQPAMRDWFNADTSANWHSVGSSDAFDVNATHANALTVTTVAQDTGESTPQALVLWGTAPIGPITQAYLSVTFPSGTTSGEAGLVFGYKSINDYWLTLLNVNGSNPLYHVVNGTRTLIGTGYPGVAVGSPNSFGLYAKSHMLSATPLSNGTPSGQIGFYTTVAGTSFSNFALLNPAVVSENGGRWQNMGFGSDGPELWQDWNTFLAPTVLKQLRLQKFQATFTLKPLSGRDNAGMQFVFGMQDTNTWEAVNIPFATTQTAPSGSQMSNGNATTSVSGTPTASATPVLTASSTLWVQVTCDGTSVYVKEATSQSGLSSAGVCYTSSSFNMNGGLFGLGCYSNVSCIDNLTINSYDPATSSFTKTELDERFTVDSSGNTVDTLTYDNNGNLTYDGVQCYTYDAWNRQLTVAHAYRAFSGDGGDGNVHAGSVFSTSTYDGKGRRISKAINGTGSMDCTYHYFYDNQSMVEEQNGSGILMRQNVWGLQYVDEIIQTALNTYSDDPGETARYWLMQDANYNVLGIADSTGVLTERYEYSAYGQRQVFTSAGSNDPGCYVPSTVSTSWRSVAYGDDSSWRVNPFGHQGLYHDEESGNIYNRARMLQPTLGRFMQMDVLGYPEGLNSYNYLNNDSIVRLDFEGLRSLTEEELKLVASMQSLKRKASSSDTELAKALDAVINDFMATVQSINSDARDPISFRIAETALQIWADPPVASTYVRTPLPPDGSGNPRYLNKCNLYVGKVLSSVGADMWIDTWRGPRYPIAGEWADDTLSIGSFTIDWIIDSAQSKDSSGHFQYTLTYPIKGKIGSHEPRMGDVVSFGDPSQRANDDHVGIYLGQGIYVSATANTNNGQVGVVIKGMPNNERRIYRSPGVPY